MIDETVRRPKRRLDRRRRILRETGAPPKPATERLRGLGRNGRASGEERKNALRGPRKSLKRLDSDKEIKVNARYYGADATVASAP
jgi:hypothetical protein